MYNIITIIYNDIYNLQSVHCSGSAYQHQDCSPGYHKWTLLGLDEVEIIYDTINQTRADPDMLTRYNGSVHPL